MRKSAVFLDRDGVINMDHGYVFRKEDFHFIDGIFDLVQTCNELGYLVVIVTNQSGIGRGYYTEKNFFDLTIWMKKIFEKNNSKIDAVYFSPYHSIYGIGKYKKDDHSRKPNAGMLMQASKDLGIKLESSIMVGDKLSDLHAGVAAGVGQNILFSSDSPISAKATILLKSSVVAFLFVIQTSILVILT